MQEIKIYKTQDLVLTIKQHYDPIKFKLQDWNRFLDILCEERQYQKDAIVTAIIYLASGFYSSIDDLVRENFYKNPELRLRYKDVDDYIKKLQLPQKLSATIDLATGTGKSYVIYGISQIMMSMGLVDNVLVLCPSRTIEKGLTRKFSELATNSRLKLAIPDYLKHKNPRIVNAAQTVMKGDICIENIHAVYERTGSSIEDSFSFGRGISTLVLNDEIHHAYNRQAGQGNEGKDIKKWKEFLLNPTYAFKYIVGFTGTSYIDNEYFNDVIFRYSLRQAIEDGYVKNINYVAKDDSSGEYQKFQKIWQNHLKNKEIYHKLRPLTILVTNNIKNAKRLETRLVEFLSEQEKLPENEIRDKKVLTITSHKDHETNLLRLDTVDNLDETIEWIVSVSMLTEGWDVKNVFQIVPMEERAFNSKLLIAQVLGRGLRIPIEYQQSKVTIFNHDSWSSKIKELVDEILEIELKLTNSNLAIGDRANFHFNLYGINYQKELKTIENNDDRKVFDYSKEYINLESAISSTVKTTTYSNIIAEEQDVDYTISYRMTSISEIVDKIYEDFRTREWEGVVLKLKESEYSKNNLPPKEKLEEIIKNSMTRAGLTGDELDEKNRTAVFATFNTLLRKTNKTVVPTRIAEEPIIISSQCRDKETISVGSLRTGSTVFYSSDYEAEIQNEEVREALQEVIDDGSLPRNSVSEINPFLFKTPVDIVFTSSEPERKFIDELCKTTNAEKISSWIKSRNQGFYSIEYSIYRQIGKHSKQASFNPDIFIRIVDGNMEYIIVVEIKADGDYSDDNQAKFKWATQYFQDLNAELSKNSINQRYIFHFLSPENYNVFFEYLRNGKLIKGEFISNLDNVLGND